LGIGLPKKRHRASSFESAEMKILIVKYNYITEGLEEELLKRGHEVTSKKIINENDIRNNDVIVVWQETPMGGARQLVGWGKTFKKKTILLQHGSLQNYKFRMSEPFNENLLSDVICVWGEDDKKRLLELGVEENRIKVTGSPVFRHLKPRVPHKGKTILFIPEHGDEDTAENLCMAVTIRKLKIPIITKLLIPNSDNFESYNNEKIDPGWYDNPVISDRFDKDHLDVCADVISKADVVVGLSESTTGIMAEALDIPVICADVWIPKAYHGDARYMNYQRPYTNACTRVKIDKLNDAIKYAIKHPEHLRKEREKVVEDNGGNIKEPIIKICDVICE
jgi:hypothetical protein